MQPLKSQLEKEDFKSKVIFNENTGVWLQFSKINNLIIIDYQGEIKTHSQQEILFTIPKEYAPKNNDLGFTTVGYGLVYGQVCIDREGRCIVSHLNSYTASARLVFSAVYTI